MNREEILAMSRQENKNEDLVEKAVETKSSTVAGLVMVSMGLIYYVAEVMIQGRKNYGFFSIAAIYYAILYTMKGVKLKDKSKLNMGIVWFVLSIIFTVEHLYFLITTSTIL